MSARDYASLDREKLIVFATACALHVSGLLLEFARVDRRDQLNGWLGQLQDLAASPATTTAQRLKAAVEAAPEATEDDSNSPNYLVMRALSTIAYAAEVWIAEDPVKYARWSAEEAEALMLMLQEDLPSSAPLLGDLEIEAQSHLLADLAHVPRDGIRALLAREEGAPISALARSAAATYAKTEGWTF